MPAKGRPASKNPRIKRIETRISATTDAELNFICEIAGLNKTSVIDKAIRLAYLLISDSRTQDDILYALEDVSDNSSMVQAQWAGVMDALSGVQARFRNINYDYLEFIRLENEYNSPEETLAELIECEYLKARSRYSAAEMDIWNRDVSGVLHNWVEENMQKEFE